MMQRVRDFICVFSLFVISVNSQCYQVPVCVDPETNETRLSGESWQTESCYRCNCIDSHSPLKTCLEFEEALNGFSSYKKLGHNRGSLERSQQLPSITVIVSPENANEFACPTPLHLSQSSTIYYRIVNYVTKSSQMDCCALFGRPIGIDSSCISVWNQEKCDYEVVERDNNSIPCHYQQHGRLGK